MKKKLLFLIIALCNIANAITINDLTNPKPLFGKVSTSDTVEINNIEINNKKNTTTEEKIKLDENSINNNILGLDDNENKFVKQEKTISNFADISLQKLAKDVFLEIDVEETKINTDLAVLWSATLEKSETMKYAIYKISNPDEDKPNDSAVKKIIKPIANISSLAGASISGNPFMATGALIGGGLMNAFFKDDKEYNYKFSKVSDADMVLLIKKVDELQKKLLELYIDYKTKEKLAKMTQENFEKREKLYKASQNKTKEEITISDVYYRTAKSNAQRAKDDFLTSRAILENLVGVDALLKIESE